MTETASAGGPSADPLDTAAAGPAAVRGGAVRVGGYLAGVALSVVASAFLFRHLGLVRSGEYGQAIALAAIAGGVSDLGLTSVGLRELSVVSGEARDRLAQSLLGLRLVLSILGVIAITGFAASVSYPSALVLGVAFGGVGLIFQSWQSTLSLSMLRDLRVGWVAGLEFARVLLTAVFIVSLVAAGAGLLPFLAVPVPVGVIVLAMNAWAVRGRLSLHPSFHAEEWRRVIRAVLPFSASVAASTLYFYIAVPVVGLAANAHQVGYFTVSARTIQVLTSVPGLAVGTALPIFARAARDDRVRLSYAIGRVFEVCLMLGVWVALCLTIGASLAIKLIGGATFSAAATPLAIQSIGLGFTFVSVVLTTALLSLERYRVILAMNIVALLGGTTLIALLASTSGARGAAIGTAVDEGVLALMNVVALARADRTLAPPLRILPAVAAAAGAATLTTLIQLPVAASVALASAVYLAVLLVFRAIPQEVLEHLPPPLRRG
ncbi:MAG TPA: oligosaccharide flippase family protein [Solirubrobacteraceae bacterium]|nr:oligosaccharide flippase family protein [Solirubrobacteraceae bacterium]